MNYSDNLENDTRQLQIDNANAMQQLLEDENFKLLFQDIFIDSFAITNTYNMWSYDDAGRRRFLEKALARSHFSHFIEQILEDGRQAIDSIRADEDTEEA